MIREDGLIKYAKPNSTYLLLIIFRENAFKVTRKGIEISVKGAGH